MWCTKSSLQGTRIMRLDRHRGSYLVRDGNDDTPPRPAKQQEVVSHLRRQFHESSGTPFWKFGTTLLEPWNTLIFFVDQLFFRRASHGHFVSTECHFIVVTFGARPSSRPSLPLKISKGRHQAPTTTPYPGVQPAVYAKSTQLGDHIRVE